MARDPEDDWCNLRTNMDTGAVGEPCPRLVALLARVEELEAAIQLHVAERDALAAIAKDVGDYIRARLAYSLVRGYPVVDIGTKSDAIALLAQLGQPLETDDQKGLEEHAGPFRALAEQNRALREALKGVAWVAGSNTVGILPYIKYRAECALSSQPPTVLPSAPEWLNQALNEGDGVYRP